MKDKDRWKTDGNCELCRRKSYCKKPCTANRKASERVLRFELMKSMAKLYRGR